MPESMLQDHEHDECMSTRRTRYGAHCMCSWQRQLDCMQQLTRPRHPTVYVVVYMLMQINTAKKRYEVGLSKLAATETSVSAMQVRLRGCILHGVLQYCPVPLCPGLSTCACCGHWYALAEQTLCVPLVNVITLYAM
jgi:hypothetical protein